MTHSDLILDKIIKQSQFLGLITKAETRSIPLKELVEDMNTYYTFMEILWEQFIAENRILTATNMLLLQKDLENKELKKEIEKLNSVINAVG